MKTNLFKVQVTAFLTLIYHEVRRFLRIWPQSILPSVITTILYFMIFGKFVGSRIGTMEGVPYITYIMPGLVMLAIIINSYANVVSSFYTARFIHCIDEILIAPISEALILAGYVTAGVIRALMVGFLVMLVALFFTKISIAHLWETILIILLTAILFSLAGFTNGLFARKFDDINIVPTFILTPLIYLGGVFYSIQALPRFWKDISYLNPIFYIVAVFRNGVLGIKEFSITESLIVILSLTIILFFINLLLLKKGVGIRN